MPRPRTVEGHIVIEGAGPESDKRIIAVGRAVLHRSRIDRRIIASLIVRLLIINDTGQVGRPDRGRRSTVSTAPTGADGAGQN